MICAINWARGLFRLWLVATVLWLAAGAWLMRDTLCPAVSVERRVEVISEGASPLILVRLDETLLDEAYSTLTACLSRPGSGDLWWHSREPALLVLAMPPICAFFLGCALLWVGRGFRR